MNVTCDVVEANVKASSSMFVDIDSLITTSGFSRSFLIWSISVVLSTNAVARDSAWLQPAAMITERAVARDAVAPQANRSLLVVEKARASERAFAADEYNVIEHVAASSTMLTTRATSVTEHAVAFSAVTLTNETSALLKSRGVARDALFGYNDLTLAERATARSSVMLSTKQTYAVIEQAVASDEAIMPGEFGNVLASKAVARDGVFMHVNANAGVVEKIKARDRLLLDMQALAWAMNAATFAMTRYTSLPFASMAVVNGRVLGLGEGGLYELAGETDLGQPVNAHVTTGRSQLGLPALKRIESVYVAGAIDGEMILTATVAGAHKGAFTYTLVPRPSESPRGHRVKLGRGLASVYWKFTLANKNGARFEIDTINADVAPSTNRRT